MKSHVCEQSHTDRATGVPILTVVTVQAQSTDVLVTAAIYLIRRAVPTCIWGSRRETEMQKNAHFRRAQFICDVPWPGLPSFGMEAPTVGSPKVRLDGRTKSEEIVRMRRTWSQAAFVAVIGIVGASFVGAAEPVQRAGELTWHTDLVKAHQVAVTSKKPMLLVFSSKNCVYCRKLESVTLTDVNVHKLLVREFVPVKLDLYRDARIAKILEIDAVPSSIILTPEADLVGRITGFVEPVRYEQELKKARALQARLQRARVVREASAAGQMGPVRR